MTQHIKENKNLDNLDNLTERANNALIKVTLFYLPITGFGDNAPQYLKDILENQDTDQYIERLMQQNFPEKGIKELKKLKHYNIHPESIEGREIVYETLREAGGWLIYTEVTGSKKRSETAVDVLEYLTKYRLFWGIQLEDALEKAVVWGESIYGNND